MNIVKSSGSPHTLRPGPSPYPHPPTMQGTIPGKFPPNLLKLFAPRPPPPFIKPLGRDPHEPGPNKLDGVADVLKRLHAENEEKLLTEEKTGQGSEAEGKEKGFTLAREYQRQLRREEKKKQKEEYKKDLEKNCQSRCWITIVLPGVLVGLTIFISN